MAVTNAQLKALTDRVLKLEQWKATAAQQLTSLEAAVRELRADEIIDDERITVLENLTCPQESRIDTLENLVCPQESRISALEG